MSMGCQRSAKRRGVRTSKGRKEGVKAREYTKGNVRRWDWGIRKVEMLRGSQGGHGGVLS